MKTKNSLFEKKIDLNNCQINGGRSGATQDTSRVNTCTDGCSDVRYVTKDDKGTTLQACTDYVCP